MSNCTPMNGQLRRNGQFLDIYTFIKLKQEHIDYVFCFLEQTNQSLTTINRHIHA